MQQTPKIIALAGAICAASAFLAPAIADEYAVTFTTARSDDDGAMRRAAVIATLTPDNGTVRMTRAGADTGLYHEWATFLSAIEATDQNGNPLSIEYKPHGIWHFPKWRRGEVTIRYDMALQHDRFANDPGDDELAVATPYGVMWTGRALFLEGAPSNNINVSFNGPEGWRVTSPWNASDATGLKFAPENTDELLDSAFFAGQHDETIVETAGIRTGMATAPEMVAERALYTATLENYLPAYASLFGASPAVAPVIIGVNNSFWGGGVMGRSISLSHGGPLNGQVSLMVRYIVAHEAFHLWNAQWQIDDRRRSAIEWTVEGTAEYYTWLTGVRTGDIPAEAFYGEITNRWATYRNALRTNSIALAGSTKLEDQNSYDLVYSGGMMATLALDLYIRDQTAQQKSYDDVLKALHSKFGSDNGAKLNERQLVRTINETTGVNLRGFFRRHISNTEVLPLGELLTGIGLCLSETNTQDAWTANLAPCDKSNSEDVSRRAAWLSAGD